MFRKISKKTAKKNDNVKRSIISDLRQLESVELELEYARITVNEHAVATRNLVKQIEQKVNSIA